MAEARGEHGAQRAARAAATSCALHRDRRRRVASLGIALGLLIDWFPVAASDEAGPIDTLWDVLLIVSVPIFVLVDDRRPLLASGASACSPGEEDLDGPPIHGNTRLEIIWTAIPAIMLVALCSYAYVVLTDIEEASADPALEVRVVGEQFTWTFYYANPDDGGRRSPRRSSTCRWASRSTSPSSPRTSSTTSGSRPSA